MVTSGVTTRPVAGGRDEEQAERRRQAGERESRAPAACERQKAAASMTTTGVSVSAMSGAMVRRSPAFTARLRRRRPRSAAARRRLAARPRLRPGRRSSLGLRLRERLCAVIRCSPVTVCRAVVISGCGQKPSSTSAAIMAREHADLAPGRGRRTTSRASPRPGTRAASSTARRRWRTPGRRRRARRPTGSPARRRPG